MLLDEIKNIKSTNKDLRGFGLLLGVASVLAGGAPLLKGGDYSYWFLVVGAVLIFLGLVFPGVLRPVYKPWIALSLALGWVTTRAILSVVFFLIVSPIGVIARIFGKRPLQLGWKDASRKSWWILREDQNGRNRRYDRQF
jgi:hypothetical protein